jgi:S-adenosylmethionine hydrolase
MPVISLTTDFGLRNEFVGILKGVIYRIAPHATLVDVTHMVAPQDIHEGSLALARAHAFFPEGTIHLYVVDPGVGTARRALAGRIGDHFFVGPDNGLLTPIMEDAERTKRSIEFVQLANPKYWLPMVSRTFHGRDIFAPVAAHLANGISLNEFGDSMTDPVRLVSMQPRKTSTGWDAHVIAIDVFGNLTTNLTRRALGGQTDFRFLLRDAEIVGTVESYGHRPPGELVAVVDSEDHIEIAEVNGNAAQRLGAKVGDVVQVILSG